MVTRRKAGAVMFLVGCLLLLVGFAWPEPLAKALGILGVSLCFGGLLAVSITPLVCEGVGDQLARSKLGKNSWLDGGHDPTNKPSE